SDANAAVEGTGENHGVRLPRLERRSRTERPSTSRAPSPTVPAPLRHRDELPPKESGQGHDDEPGSGLPAVVGRPGLFASPSVGGIDGGAGSSFESVAQSLD